MASKLDQSMQALVMARQILERPLGAAAEPALCKATALDALLRRVALASSALMHPVRLAIDHHLWAASFDSEGLLRVLGNLIGNAKECMPEGGAILVKAQNCRSGPGTLGGKPCVSISVYDHGPGIPKHLSDQLFLPGFTTKPRSQGLGLHSTTLQVSAMGGEIRLRSALGKGSSFTVYLPACPPAPMVPPTQFL